MRRVRHYDARGKHLSTKHVPAVWHREFIVQLGMKAGEYVFVHSHYFIAVDIDGLLELRQVPPDLPVLKGLYCTAVVAERKKAGRSFQIVGVGRVGEAADEFEQAWYEDKCRPNQKKWDEAYALLGDLDTALEEVRDLFEGSRPGI